jgi:hypothetical protein
MLQHIAPFGIFWGAVSDMLKHNLRLLLDTAQRDAATALANAHQYDLDACSMALLRAKTSEKRAGE